MAVIRCPSCGKPNPEFLDVCQYCDQPLKEASEAGAAPAAGGTIRKSIVVRCPNCDKANPEFLDKCQFCDAPLKKDGATPTESGEAAPADLPDWLQALRGEATAGAAPIAPEAAPEWEAPASAEPGDMPDWLKVLQGEGAAPAEPAADVPDWLKSLSGTGALTPEAPARPAEPAAELPAEPSSAGDMPDWLSGGTGALTPETPPWPAEPAAETPVEPLAAGDLPDWLRGGTGALTPAPSEEPAAEPPDWLKGASAAGPTGESPIPDWLKAATGPLAGAPAPEAAATEDLPDWLQAATGPLTPPAAPAAPAKGVTSPFLGAPSEGEAEVPDWLRDMSGGEAPAAPTPAVSATAPLPAILPGPEDEPDFLNNLRGAAAPVVEEEQPDWLQSLGLPETPASGTPALDFSTPAPSPPAEDEPDWMRALRSAGTPAEAAPAPAEAEPDWLSALRTESPSGGETSGPAIAPFGAVLGAAAEELAEPGPATPTPAGGEPDWLAALRPSGPPPEAGPAPGSGAFELAQGELPSWLAALRPVEIQRAIEPEVDEYQESVGVLAGMRGVLRAEPSVVLPGKSATNVHTLAFTDPQAKQAELLAGMLLSDREAAPAARRRLRRIPWERWLVAVLILAGMLLPPFALPRMFVQPTTAAPAALAAFEQIDRLDPAKPVLVAFDYEPAHVGEMGRLAEALVGHLVRRGLPLVAVSTSPTGAGVGQEVLATLTAQNTYREAETYLNLGYLPGGPVGILQLALAPRTVFLADFYGEAYTDQGGLWELPLLRNVGSLADFGAVVVLSATPEDARAWIEQTQGRPTPLILAVSAGSGPLILPYYEADQAAPTPRLAGLVAGVVGATQYDARAGVTAPDATLIQWEMLGGGLLWIALLLVLGNLFNGALLALRRSQKRKA